MIQVAIYRHKLPIKPRFLRYRDQFDYLGQIIVQVQPTIRMEDGLATPQQLNRYIHPFTYTVRGTICNTKLTLDILRIDSLPDEMKEARLVELLSPYYEITFLP